MSLNSIIESNKAKLCDCTDPNKSLLNKLNNFGIITDGMRSSLLAETDKETASLELYQFLKNARTDKDLPNIMLALEKSSNTAAHDIFKQYATKSDVKSIPQNPNVKQKMKVNDIGRILYKDYNVREALGTFHEVFDVSFGELKPKHGLVTVGMKPGGEYIGDILSVWKGTCKFNEGIGKNLLKFLEDAEYNNAAQDLRDAGLGDDTIVIYH